MDYKLLSFLLRSRLSRRILEVLDTPKSPTQIARETKIARSNVSTKLVQLLDRGLVVCKNPHDKKWRFYQITKLGKEVLGEVEKIK